MTPARAFADAFCDACKRHGALTEPKRDHPIFARLADKALHFAREHYRREKSGEKLEGRSAYAARYLAPWAYDHEPEFASMANSAHQGEAWRSVWTPACAAAIDASRIARDQERAARAGEGRKAA